jgi:hypothetical protein
MNFYKIRTEGYLPTYVRDDFTELLHEKFQLQTDRQIITTQEMKNIFKTTKNRKTLLKKREKTKRLQPLKTKGYRRFLLLQVSKMGSYM